MRWLPLALTLVLAGCATEPLAQEPPPIGFEEAKRLTEWAPGLQGHGLAEATSHWMDAGAPSGRAAAWTFTYQALDGEGRQAYEVDARGATPVAAAPGQASGACARSHVDSVELAQRLVESEAWQRIRDDGAERVRMRLTCLGDTSYWVALTDPLPTVGGPATVRGVLFTPTGVVAGMLGDPGRGEPTAALLGGGINVQHEVAGVAVLGVEGRSEAAFETVNAVRLGVVVETVGPGGLPVPAEGVLRLADPAGGVHALPWSTGPTGGAVFRLVDDLPVAAYHGAWDAEVEAVLVGTVRLSVCTGFPEATSPHVACQQLAIAQGRNGHLA